MRYLVGIGSYWMGDDGIGPRLAEAIADRGLNEGFEVLDIGDNGLNLLSYFEDPTQKMLWVDCCRMGLRPGEFRFFTPDEVETKKYLARRTTHEGDFLKVIEIARVTGYPIPHIEIMGIEPESTGEGRGLSSVLAMNFERYVNEAIRRMKAD